MYKVNIQVFNSADTPGQPVFLSLGKVVVSNVKANRNNLFTEARNI